MAAIVQAQTGDWNATATWTGAVIPVSGDTVTLLDGATCTIPSGYTAVCGTSPGDDVSTPAIQCSSTTGTGILAIEGTFQFQGSVKQANATWTASAGAILEHDSSAGAGTPSYTWQIGMAANQANASFNATGVNGNRWIARNAASSGRFGGWTGGQTTRIGDINPTGGFSGAGRAILKYGTLQSIGEVGIEWLTTTLGSDGNNLTLENILADDCTMYVATGFMHGGAIYREINCSWLNVNGVTAQIVRFFSALTTGERTVSGVISEGSTSYVNLKDLTTSDSAYAGATTGGYLGVPLRGNSTVGNFALFDDIMVYNRLATANNDSNMPLGAVATRLVSLRAGTTGDNDHFRTNLSASASAPSVDGAVLEFAGTVAGGDLFVMTGAPAALMPISFKNMLSLSNSVGTSSGTMVAHVIGGPLNMRLTIENNTQIGGNLGAAPFLCEISTLGIGTVPSIQNNIVYATSTQTGLIQNESTTAPDADSFTTADYNASFNISTVDQYISADTAFVNLPGTNDITDDPDFVDDTRDFLSWGQSIDAGITTWDEIWTEIAKRNDDTGFNPLFDWKEFYTWARAGYAPQDTAYELSGYDGGVRGAVPFFVPVPSTGIVQLTSPLTSNLTFPLTNNLTG